MCTEMLLPNTATSYGQHTAALAAFPSLLFTAYSYQVKLLLRASAGQLENWHKNKNTTVLNPLYVYSMSLHSLNF